jgi:hypothetical protein
MTRRTIKKLFVFSKNESEQIEKCAESDGLPFAAWARNVLLMESQKRLNKASNVISISKALASHVIRHQGAV